MTSIRFDDIHQARESQREQIRRKRDKARWLLPLLPGFMSLLRVFGLEGIFFRRFFRPINRRIDHQANNSFDGYSPTANDIIVCSYFKSGTHWAMQVAHQIANRGDGEFDCIYDVIPWNEAPASGAGLRLADPRPLQLSKTGKRVIKTHACAENVPYRDEARYLCVIRDPKDVFVSSYHFMAAAMLGPLMPSVETWLSIYLSEEAFWRPWSDFTNSYWPWRERKNVFFLTYEEMQADPRAMAERLAEFIGVDLTGPELEKVLSKSSYQYMRANDHKFHFSVGTPLSPPDGKMIRRGKKGASGELINAEQQERIDRYCRQRLLELGSDFPYDHYYGSTSSP